MTISINIAGFPDLENDPARLIKKPPWPCIKAKKKRPAPENGFCRKQFSKRDRQSAAQPLKQLTLN